MPTQNAEQNNIVELSGLVYRINIKEDKETGAAVAGIELLTAPVVKDENGIRYDFAKSMHHRIRTVTSDPATKRKLHKIQEDCNYNLTNFSKENFKAKETPMEVTGCLMFKTNRNTGNPEPFVKVDESGLSFPKKLKMKNEARLSGTITDISQNNAYASVIIETSENNHIPVSIDNSGNPKIWKLISEGKLKKSDRLDVEGSLQSRQYANGDKQIFRCSVQGAKIRHAEKKKTQTVSLS